MTRQETGGCEGKALAARIGLVDVVMLGAGAAMGVSIFSVLAPAARVSGSGLLIAAIIAVLPMALFAVVYGFMSSVVPRTGASYEWPRLFMHPFAGFLVAWLRIVGSVGVLVTLALVFVQYMSLAVPLPQRPTMFVLLFAVFLVNIRGLKISARAQTFAMSLLLTTFAIFIAAGLAHIRASALGDPFEMGWLRVLTGVPLLLPLFLGIETATEVGEEVRNPTRTIPLALALALALTLMVFLAVAVTALGLLGPQRLAASQAPLIDAGRQSLDGFALPLIVTAAGLAIVKSLNSIFIVFSRYLFAMARAGVLPRVIARLHPRWGTPHIACCVAFGLAVAGLAMPNDLVFLFVAISIPTVIKYGSTSICALALVHFQPELAQTSKLALGRHTVSLFAILGIGCAVTILLLGLAADWRSYLLIGTWGLLGLVYWFATDRGLSKQLLSRRVSIASREGSRGRGDDADT